MKRVLVTLLLGGAVAATPLGVAAQSEEEQKPCLLFENAAEGSFKAQIEGESITLPCSWSDLKQLGWQFGNPLDGEEILAPLDNTIRLTSVGPIVANTRTGQMTLLFCNTDSVARPRSACIVFGMQTGVAESSGFNTDERPKYMQGEASTDFYAFELPGGIRGGLSTEKQVVETYGKVSYVLGVSTEKGYKRLLNYTSEAGKPEVRVQVCTDEKGEQAGMVTGFIARTEGVIKHYIAKNPGLISDYEADSLVQRDHMTGRMKEMIARIESGKERDKAFEYFSKADQTDLVVRLVLAECYFRGRGTEQNPATAARYYRSCLQELETNETLSAEEQKTKKEITRLLGGKLKKFK